MDSIEEKRVYGDRGGATRAYVASSIGVVRVHVAGDTVGEFSLCTRCETRDIVATADGTVAIATDEDVRVLAASGGDGSTGGTGGGDSDAGGGDDGSGDGDDTTFVDTGFGPAVAVGSRNSTLVAAGPDGRIAARQTAGNESGDWTNLEFSDDTERTSVRAIDGDLVATDDGVYRLHDGELEHAGLSDVRDVSAAGVPLAATADGLYKLGNGWMSVLGGVFETVTAHPRTEAGRLSNAHAVETSAGERPTASETSSAVSDSNSTVYAFTGEDWTAIDTPAEQIVDIGYGAGPVEANEIEQQDAAAETNAVPAGTIYAVTAQGTVLVPSGTGSWRRRSLGITGVTGIAVPVPSSSDSERES